MFSLTGLVCLVCGCVVNIAPSTCHLCSPLPPCLQIVLHPLTVHLTYSLGLALQEYFQLGGRDEAAEDAETEGETEAAVRGGREDTGGGGPRETYSVCFTPLPTHPTPSALPTPPCSPPRCPRAGSTDEEDQLTTEGVHPQVLYCWEAGRPYRWPRRRGWLPAALCLQVSNSYMLNVPSYRLSLFCHHAPFCPWRAILVTPHSHLSPHR